MRVKKRKCRKGMTVREAHAQFVKEYGTPRRLGSQSLQKFNLKMCFSCLSLSCSILDGQ
jgi:hypothetical protein